MKENKNYDFFKSKKKEELIDIIFKHKETINDLYDLVIKNEQLRKENEELRNQQTQLAVDKLEELLKYIINSKWTKTVNVKHSPMQIIVNKINEMINELKGGAE